MPIEEMCSSRVKAETRGQEGSSTRVLLATPGFGGPVEPARVISRGMRELNGILTASRKACPMVRMRQDGCC